MNKSPWLALHFTTLQTRRLDGKAEISRLCKALAPGHAVGGHCRFMSPRGKREEYFREVDLLCRVDGSRKKVKVERTAERQFQEPFLKIMSFNFNAVYCEFYAQVSESTKFGLPVGQLCFWVQ